MSSFDMCPPGLPWWVVLGEGHVPPAWLAGVGHGVLMRRLEAETVARSMLDEWPREALPRA